MNSFWPTLPKPILALAPMEDVTDTVFRQIVGACARPDVFFTEFTSSDGLFSKGRGAVIERFKFTPTERPIVAQVWGRKPENFYKAARLVVSLGFDGIDINIGCPERSVVKAHCAAALINEPEQVREIIHATRQGINSRIPISVKTRIGYKKISMDWIQFLLEQHLDALIIHGRTAAELSKVPAHWDVIGNAVRIRNQMNIPTIIIGNGDVKNYRDALEMHRKYGVDGVMIGRGIFDNLWAFDRSALPHVPTKEELLTILVRHVELFEKTWGPIKNFAVMKKYFKIYVHNFDGASSLRERLMEARAPADVYAMIQRHAIAGEQSMDVT